MCGIAGIFSSKPVEAGIVERMLATIAYRGPDNTSVKVYRSENGSHLTVGQARLAILDPRPEADQPFQNARGTSVITFNGEFYNFLELRKTLEQEAVPLRTRSDTEVALEYLDREGMAALNRLWGMFAGTYFNLVTGKLLLFRDRLGKKPLYIYRHSGRLYFASEPKAILAVLDHRPEPDDHALKSFFYLGYIPNDQCAFRGMYKLAAGHCVEIGPEQEPRTCSWYHAEDEPPLTEEDLEPTFMNAVALRMISDVPLSAFLSGGLDSSLVVAAMSRIAAKAVNTFSVRFEGPQAFDESPFARAVSRHCGTDHHEVVLDMAALRVALPDVLDHFDEPFGDSSAVPMFLVSKAARKLFTVALSGDGADEVFAGYRKYLGEHYIRKLGPYPLRKWLWRPLSRLLPTGRTSARLERNRRIRRLLRGDGRRPAERHINWLNMSPLDVTGLLGPRLSARGFVDLKRELTARAGDGGLNQILKFDQGLVLQDDMFVKADRMSMKASLEVRCPFVDHRLVNLANRLAPNRKLDGTIRKKVLLDRLGHMLPPEILNRPKTGFEMPIGAWLRSDLRGWTEDRLFHYAQTQPWVDHSALRQVWHLHASGKLDCTETLWHHLVFATWFRAMYGSQ